MPLTTVGLLFAYDWDWRAFGPMQGADLRWDHYGFDLFSFPSNLRLAGFDMRRTADRLAERGRRAGWRGVLSHHEQFGALTAALVAERLRLPGAPVESILAAQHKWHARRVLQQVEHLKCDLKDYASGLKGHVRILANTTSITSALPAALASFLAGQSDVSIDLQERLSQDIVVDINEARADIGIVAGDIDTEGLEVRPFASDELVVVVPHGHPLAEVPQTSFLQTLDDPQISLQEGSALAGFLPPLARAMGRNLDFRIQVSSFESICLLVEAGVGIGIIPRSSALRHAQTMRLHIVSLSDAWATREMKIVHRADIELPRLAGELVRHLESFASLASL